MSDIPYTVRQASSGDAKGLVRSQQWITNEPVKKAFVLLALDEPCTIKQIQGRNHCAAFIEVKVANNVDKYDESDFTEFLPMQTLRTSSQISSDQRKEEKFSFEKQLSWKHAQRKWNRIAVLLENPFNPMIKLGLLNLTIIGSSGAEFELKGATLDVPLLDNDEMDRSLDEDSKDVELEMNRKERRGEIRSQSASSSQNDNMPAPSPKKSTKSSQEDKKPKMPTSKFVSLDFSSEDEEPPVKSTKKESSQKDSQKSDKKEKKKEKKEETKVEKKKPAKDVPYKELLQGVTLVISGIENPERAIIRETALKVRIEH
jgi:DNA-repair protein XRCC1